MQELKSLEEALETTIEGIFLAKQSEHFSKIPEAPLFFPRKKLKMTKVYSGNWEPWSWFIQERLSEKSTELDCPINASHEGLTSGFRSALIKNSNGTYTKLKGVSLKPTITLCKKDQLTKNIIRVGAKGLSFLCEAYSEMKNLQILNYLNESIAPYYPSFIEIYKLPQNPLQYTEFLQDIKSSPARIICSPVKCGQLDKLKQEGKSIKKQFDTWPSAREYDYCVIGTEICGDTRLDEASYQLTKKDLTGGLKEKRDEILRYLFFRAGVANGMLTTNGFTWSSDLVYSNSHFGNFMLRSRKGNLDIGICDLGTAMFRLDFSSDNEFMDFAKKEVDNFKHEFDNTASLTVQRSYRHFPKKLKGECLDALKTGYAMVLFESFRAEKDILMHYEAPRIIAPDNAILNVDEFKNLIEEIKVA